MCSNSSVETAEKCKETLIYRVWYFAHLKDAFTCSKYFYVTNVSIYKIINDSRCQAWVTYALKTDEDLPEGPDLKDLVSLLLKHSPTNSIILDEHRMLELPKHVQIIGPGYLTTLQGACKVIEAISSMIAVLLVTLDFMGFVIDIFQAAGVISSIVSVIFFIVYITGLVEKSTLPWNRIQFFFHFLWSIFYVAAIVLIYVEGYSYPKIIAGGVFGIVAVMAHLVDSVDNYKKQPLCNLGEK